MKKKIVLIFSLCLLAMLVFVNTPSFVDANNGRELSNVDFDSFDVIFSKDDHEDATSHKVLVLDTTPKGTELYFKVKFDLTKITSEATPDSSRLQPGDYFIIELPTELPPVDYLIAPGSETAKLRHDVYHDKVIAIQEAVDLSNGKKGIKVVFQNDITDPEIRNNIKGYVFVTLRSLETEFGTHHYDINTPNGNYPFDIEYEFIETANAGEVLLKLGPAFTQLGQGKFAFDYGLRVNIREQNLGTVVLEDNLLDGFGKKDLLDQFDYSNIALQKGYYEKVGDQYSNTFHPTDYEIKYDQLLAGDGVSTPRLEHDKANKSFKVIIPNVGTDAYYLRYQVNNPLDGTTIQNYATISNNGVKLFPDDDHRNKNQYEFFARKAKMILEGGGGGQGTPDKKVTLNILKLNEQGEPLDGVEFRLKKVSDGTHTPTQATDSSGVVIFSNLDKGKYEIEEVKALPGYEPLGKTIEINLNEEQTYEKIINKAEKSDKIDIEVKKLCKVDPQNPKPIDPTQDKGRDLALLLQRKLQGEDDSKYMVVEKQPGKAYGLMLKQKDDKVVFSQVEKASGLGTPYVYRVVDVTKPMLNVTFSDPEVSADKITITVTKDCSDPNANIPKPSEKIDVEVSKLCKVDPITSQRIEPTKDKGAEPILILQRKLGDQNTKEFKTVYDVQGHAYELKLEKTLDKIVFKQVDKRDADGKEYVYRVIEKVVNSKPTPGLDISNSFLINGKISITVTKDCNDPNTIPPLPVEKIDVEVSKLCKVDPQTSQQIPPTQDKGAELVLVLERKLKDQDDKEFKTVNKKQGGAYELTLARTADKVVFTKVEQTDAKGKEYVYRVVEKTANGKPTADVVFSEAKVLRDKISITVTKDCGDPNANIPKPSEKIDVEVSKVCKVDPQTSQQIPPTQDKGAELILVLERKLENEDDSKFKAVEKTAGQTYELTLTKALEKVIFGQVDKTDANGKAYVYRVVEKLVNGTPTPNVTISAPAVSGNKMVITVTKDCHDPNANIPKPIEKLDVEVSKVCKIDLSKPIILPKDDKGAELVLLLQRKLENQADSEFKSVEKTVGQVYELKLEKTAENVKFEQVDKTDAHGNTYVYRVVEKVINGNATPDVTFSNPVVSNGKIVITVTKDCTEVKSNQPNPPSQPNNPPTSPSNDDDDDDSSSEGSGTVSKVERISGPNKPSNDKPSNDKPSNNSPSGDQPSNKQEGGIKKEGKRVENNETNVLPGVVPKQPDSSSNTAKKNKGVSPSYKRLPKTGEGLNTTAYAAIALLGGASLVAYGVFRKKNQA